MEMLTYPDNASSENQEPIPWSSREQQNIALSLTEAEYHVVRLATCEAVRWRQVLADLGPARSTYSETVAMLLTDLGL